MFSCLRRLAWGKWHSIRGCLIFQVSKLSYRLRSNVKHRSLMPQFAIRKTTNGFWPLCIYLHCTLPRRSHYRSPELGYDKVSGPIPYSNVKEWLPGRGPLCGISLRKLRCLIRWLSSHFSNKSDGIIYTWHIICILYTICLLKK